MLFPFLFVKFDSFKPDNGIIDLTANGLNGF